MINGIGIDIVEVADLERRLKRSAFDRVFSEAEQAYAERRPKRRAEILAARWAAKEAFLKALGTGIRAEWPLNQIEIVHDGEGRPEIRLTSPHANRLPQGARVHVSLTHTEHYAAAVVVIET